MLLYIFDVSSYLYRVSKKMQSDSDDGELGTSEYVLSIIATMMKDRRKVSYMVGENTHICFVFDHPGESFRSKIFPDYKGGRQTDLFIKDVEKQLKKKLISDGFPHLEIEGVEADDVIYTLSRKCEIAGVRVVVFSGDKDMLVAVSESTRQYVGGDKKLYDTQKVIDKYGVNPIQITDYLAIVGDKTDNIKGIPNAGAAAAVAILSKYELADVIEDPELIMSLNIKGKASISKYIRDNRVDVEMCVRLVKMLDDIELNVSLKMLRFQ